MKMEHSRIFEGSIQISTRFPRSLSAFARDSFKTSNGKKQNKMGSSETPLSSHCKGKKNSSCLVSVALASRMWLSDLLLPLAPLDGFKGNPTTCIQEAYNEHYNAIVCVGLSFFFFLTASSRHGSHETDRDHGMGKGGFALITVTISTTHTHLLFSPGGKQASTDKFSSVANINHPQPSGLCLSWGGRRLPIPQTKVPI